MNFPRLIKKILYSQMKKSILLFIVLLLLTLGVEIHAENTENTRLLYAIKPLIIGTLIALLFYTSKPLTSSFGKWIAIGLVFSFIGDSLLMIREIDLFIPGLASFLVAQIIYALTFYSQKDKQKPVKTKTIIIGAFLLFYLSFMAFILPYITKLEDVLILLPAVIIYGTVICLMGIAAALRQNENNASYYSILLGAVFFIASDTILATNKFAFEISNANFWVMSTYTMAQLGIVLGAVFWLRKKN